MDRRTFLTTAAALATVGVAGCTGRSGSDRATSTPMGGRFYTPRPAPNPTTDPPAEPATEPEPAPETLDLSPGQEVSGIVADVESGEQLVFPSGTFTWSEQAVVTADDWGIWCEPDTVFEVPAGWGDGSRGIILATVTSDRVADNFVLENLTYDSPGRAAPQLWLGTQLSARIDGLEYRMNGPLSHQQQGNGIAAFVTDPDGLFVIDDYTQYNNGDLAGYGGGNSRVGIYVGPLNQGTIRLRNPVLQGFPNNACYVSRQPGTVTVEGGLLLNNNVSAVRISGGVEVRGTTVVVDTERYVGGPGRIDGSSHNTRGFWADNRSAGTDGGLVTDCSVVVESYRRCTGLAEILENPWLDVENTQFLLNDALEAIRADSGRINVRNCTFDAAVDGSVAGVGDVAGSGNRVHPDVEPGQVPVEDFDDYAFEWCRAHPRTPGFRTHAEGQCVSIGRSRDGFAPPT